MIRPRLSLSEKPILHRCFASLLLLATALPASAQTLTAQEVERLALERPELRTLAEAPLEAAEGELLRARTWRNPTFNYQREGVDGFGGDGSENFYSLQREFDLSGRRALERRSAEAAVDAARYGAIRTRAELKAEAARRFYDLLAARADLARLSALEESLTRLADQTAARARAGDASQYDLERVRQAALAVGPMRAEAEADRIAARGRLGALIGPDRLAGFDGVEGDLLPPTLTALRARTGERLVAVAELEAEAEAADLAARAAGRAFPEVTLGAGVKTLEGPAEETGFLVNLSVPLPVFDRNQGARRAAAARAWETEARARLERDAYEAEVAALASRAEALREAALTYREGALASAGELRRVATISFGAGEIAVFEAIDALDAAAEAEARAIRLARDAREAFIQLTTLLPETDQ